MRLCPMTIPFAIEMQLDTPCFRISSSIWIEFFEAPLKSVDGVGNDGDGLPLRLGELEHRGELLALAAGRRLDELKYPDHFEAFACAIVDEALALGARWSGPLPAPSSKRARGSRLSRSSRFCGPANSV